MISTLENTMFSPPAIVSTLATPEVRSRASEIRSHMLRLIDVTLYLAQEPPGVPDAVDREIRRQYREGPERNGILVQAVCCEIAADARTAPLGSLARERDHLRYADLLAPCIETHRSELGYAKFSEYVTGLIRYDLMLLGPHKYFSGDDTDPH